MYFLIIDSNDSKDLNLDDKYTLFNLFKFINIFITNLIDILTKFIVYMLIY